MPSEMRRKNAVIDRELASAAALRMRCSYLVKRSCTAIGWERLGVRFGMAYILPRQRKNCQGSLDTKRGGMVGLRCDLRRRRPLCRSAWTISRAGRALVG